MSDRKRKDSNTERDPENDIDQAFEEYNRFLAYTQLSEYGQKRADSQLSCTGKLTKRFLVIMNMLFVCAGAGMIVAGLYLTQASAGSLLGDGLSFAVMALGGVIATVAVVGACGAGFERRRCLQAYIALLTLMILGSIGAGVYTFYRTNSVESFVASAWDAVPTIQKLEIQQELQCCGLRFNDSHAAQPCPMGTHDGCEQKVIDDLTSHLAPVEYASIGVGAFMLLGISCSCSFLCSMRTADKKTKHNDVERQRTRQSLLNPLIPRSDSVKSKSKTLN